ncbi:hypothetical protein Afil01_29870 [Actinorhabdospora filicis]|uniref:DUF397 domain-containing protein n=1 Tax=Actinorhabdospora filicis TaxID=1785913 RepID=A0A9W6SLM6_9ACTN|nr:DUF397 domain-containing protein [Actinorhabdospora filicis]GLZ78180.1 hypothetical protein Afil01_29870 [Actinorhabdospora filicis]
MAQPDLTHARWRRSTRSNGGGGNSNCVETALVDGAVVVRDSKDCAASGYPVLLADRVNWTGFIALLKGGALGR